jgi:hypothetical protein
MLAKPRDWITNGTVIKRLYEISSNCYLPVRLKYLSMAGICYTQIDIHDCAFRLYLQGRGTIERISTSTKFNQVIVTCVMHQRLCSVAQPSCAHLGETIVTKCCNWLHKLIQMLLDQHGMFLAHTWTIKVCGILKGTSEHLSHLIGWVFQ